MHRDNRIYFAVYGMNYIETGRGQSMITWPSQLCNTAIIIVRANYAAVNSEKEREITMRLFGCEDHFSRLICTLTLYDTDLYLALH